MSYFEFFLLFVGAVFGTACTLAAWVTWLWCREDARRHRHDREWLNLDGKALEDRETEREEPRHG